jgi:transposase-like protein
MTRVGNDGKSDRWRALLAEKETSGESVVEFCGRHGLPVHQFYWWRRRLAEGRGMNPPAKQSVPSSFVPVRLSLTQSMIEVIHPGGCMVRISGRVDSAALRSVLEALRTGEA